MSTSKTLILSIDWSKENYANETDHDYFAAIDFEDKIKSIPNIQYRKIEYSKELFMDGDLFILVYPSHYDSEIIKIIKSVRWFDDCVVQIISRSEAEEIFTISSLYDYDENGELIEKGD